MARNRNKHRERRELKTKRAIENQQTLERNKLEKAYKVRPSTAQGQSMMASQSKMGASKMGRS